MVSLLAGCGTVGDGKDKTLSVAITSKILTLDQHKMYDIHSASCAALTYSMLYRFDERNNPIPYMAESSEVSEDGLTYTIHIREGLKYSNGEPITAMDYADSFKRFIDPDTGAMLASYLIDNSIVVNARDINLGKLGVDELGVETPDAHTLVVHLEKPCPFFFSVLASPSLSPFDQKFYESCAGSYGSSPDTVLSSGPYIVDRYEPLGTETHFIKNPYFVDKDEIYMDEITIRSVADAQQSMMCYQTGLVDIINIYRDFVKLVNGDPALNINTGSTAYYIKGNSKTKNPWNNKNIRIALSLAIDRESYAHNVENDLMEPLTGLIPRGLAKEPDGSDFCDDTVRYPDVCSYDPDRARDYFEKGLSELGTDHIKMKLIFMPTYQQIAEVVIQNWKKVFPELEIEPRSMQSNQLVAELAGNDYDIDITGWVGDFPDTTSFFIILREKNSTNFEGYVNREFEEVMKKSELETDPEKRSKLLHEAEDIIMNDLALIPIVSTGLSRLINTDIKGMVQGIGGSLPYYFTARRENG